MRTEYRGFVGGSNVTQSPIADGEDTINMYVEIMTAASKSRATLWPVPGLSTFFSVTQGPVRALFAQDGRAFAVIGFKFFEFFSDGSSTDYGDVALDTNPATISSNGSVVGAHQLFITTGGEGYVFDLDADTLTHVVSDVTAGGFVDGFFVAFDITTSTFRISELEDGTIWDPSQARQRNTAGDQWVCMLVKNREVWLYGSQTTDVYVNTGAYPFPFEPIPNVLIQQGAAASFGASVVAEQAIWLSANADGQGQIMRSNGYSAEPISPPSLANQLQGYGTISDAVAYSYQDRGHTFYVINLITAGVTWMYDMTTGLWTKRLFKNTATGEWEAHRGFCHCFAFGKHLIGDRSTGKVYEQSTTIATDADDEPLVRVRRGGSLNNNGLYVYLDEFQLDMRVGIGVANGQGSNPIIWIRVSRDGGETWGQPKRITAGRRGRRGTLVRWRRLGRAYDFRIEVQCSDPVPWMFNQAWVDFEAEAA